MGYTYEFPRAALTTDAILIGRRNDRMMVALICRGREPFKGKWALPGGFVNTDETLADACRRELFEETGTDIENPLFFGIYDALDRDPRGRTISVVFYKIVGDVPTLSADDDASQAEWFPLDNLPDLAFDHSVILNDFLSRSGIT